MRERESIRATNLGRWSLGSRIEGEKSREGEERRSKGEEEEEEEQEAKEEKETRGSHSHSCGGFFSSSRSTTHALSLSLVSTATFLHYDTTTATLASRYRYWVRHKSTRASGMLSSPPRLVTFILPILLSSSVANGDLFHGTLDLHSCSCLELVPVALSCLSITIRAVDIWADSSLYTYLSTITLPTSLPTTHQRGPNPPPARIIPTQPHPPFFLSQCVVLHATPPHDPTRLSFFLPSLLTPGFPVAAGNCPVSAKTPCPALSAPRSTRRGTSAERVPGFELQMDVAAMRFPDPREFVCMEIHGCTYSTVHMCKYVLWVPPVSDQSKIPHTLPFSMSTVHTWSTGIYVSNLPGSSLASD